MARRANPERIREARVAARRARLASTGMPPDRLDALWAAWEAQAQGDGLDPYSAAYWTAADAWLDGQAGGANPGLPERPSASNQSGPLAWSKHSR